MSSLSCYGQEPHSGFSPHGCINGYRKNTAGGIAVMVKYRIGVGAKYHSPNPTTSCFTYYPA